MSRIIAGQQLTLTIDTHTVQVKVEDASKSDAISAKVESSDSETYRIGNVYDFDRSLLN